MLGQATVRGEPQGSIGRRCIWEERHSPQELQLVVWKTVLAEDKDLGVVIIAKKTVEEARMLPLVHSLGRRFVDSLERQGLLTQFFLAGLSLVIANEYYRFHSFALELGAFAATWYVFDLARNLTVRGLGKLRRHP